MHLLGSLPFKRIFRLHTFGDTDEHVFASIVSDQAPSDVMKECGDAKFIELVRNVSD